MIFIQKALRKAEIEAERHKDPGYMQKIREISLKLGLSTPMVSRSIKSGFKLVIPLLLGFISCRTPDNCIHESQMYRKTIPVTNHPRNKSVFLLHSDSLRVLWVPGKFHREQSVKYYYKVCDYFISIEQ